MRTKKLAIHWQILIAILLGALFGVFLSEHIKYIQWAGDMFLRALRMIIIPIIFTSLTMGVASIGGSADLGRIAGKTFAFYISTTLIAATLGLVFVNIFQPGVGADVGLSESVESIAATESSFIDQIVGIIPANIFADMADGNILPLIFFSILFGFFITRVGEKSKNFLVDFFSSTYDVIIKITMFIIRLAPIGVFAIVATMIGKQAGDMDKLLKTLSSLGLFVGIVWAGCLIQTFIILPAIVRFIGKSNPWKHMSKMSTAILTAFSTCSSAAALPISLRDTQEKVGVSNKIASFTLPLGATVNMNGTALYESVAVLFIAQAYGIELTIVQQIMVVATVLLAAIGTASIPMAGLVMISVVLSAVGLPLEGIGLVLAVEQLCDMPRTATNSYGDMCAAVVIAKSEGEVLKI
ncbi:MAG: dicarboxylate/amino acid:cation symporter [Bacteroidales bacterium]|nr:dicarboxylate/amino acid:cation symporter [Bacteroidales bacterium]